MFPNPSGREGRSARFFRFLQSQQRPRASGVRVAATRAGKLLGAALWSEPGSLKASPFGELTALPAYALIYGFRNLPRGTEIERTLQAAHPSSPHWYLPALATDPAFQRAGIGTALMRQQLTQCERLGASVYLEASKPSNVPFYERLGFRITGEILLPGGGPSLISMWRESNKTFGRRSNSLT
ncbi:GNAT family N-acetyltransferase [Streptomyces virginiae]